jgi:hypothetical protein
MKIGLYAAALGIAIALPSSATAQSPTVALLDYKTTVPNGWSSRTPSSSARLAEYTVPGTDNAGGVEVVVYFFGKGQGGNVQANLTRWKGQFSTPDGSPVPETITRDSTGIFPVTYAEYRGTYRRGIGAGSADSVRAGQSLIAAIAETPRGTMFIQMFGPSAQVAAQRDAFMAFVRGLKDSGPAKPPAR